MRCLPRQPQAVEQTAATSIFRRPWCCIVPILALHGGLLAWGAWIHSPAIDEVGHLASGLAIWQEGRFDMYCVNPPLVRMVAALPVVWQDPKTDWREACVNPAGRPEFDLGRQLIAANGARSFWFFTLARWMCIPFSLLGGYICFRWASELYGTLAGLMALTLWCFCPNILGQAQMITPDTGATALGLAATYLFWHWLKEPCWSQAYLAGLVLGLAELAKSTWLVLFLIWPCLWIICWWPRLRRLRFSAHMAQVSQLLGVLSLALYLLNLGYAFDGSFQRLGDYRFVSWAFTGSDSQAAAHAGNRFAGTWLANLPVPLPKYYVLGIDIQKREFESNLLSYLRGEWRRGGWWYYYLYGLAVKVPLGTIALVFLSLLAVVLGHGYAALWRDELVLALPPLVVLILVSSQTGLNHHLRYVLPIFPFVFISVSRLAGSKAGNHRRSSVAETSNVHLCPGGRRM